jgi:hypothetical protein
MEFITITQRISKEAIIVNTRSVRVVMQDDDGSLIITDIVSPATGQCMELHAAERIAQVKELLRKASAAART